MVLAISLVIMSLLTLRRVTGASPIISLRSAKAGWGKNLSVRIFAFLSLSLVASDSPGLRIIYKINYSIKFLKIKVPLI